MGEGLDGVLSIIFPLGYVSNTQNPSGIEFLPLISKLPRFVPSLICLRADLAFCWASA